MLFSCKHALIINRQWHNSLSSNMLSPLYLHSIKLCVCVYWYFYNSASTSHLSKQIGTQTHTHAHTHTSSKLTRSIMEIEVLLLFLLLFLLLPLLFLLLNKNLNKNLNAIFQNMNARLDAERYGVCRGLGECLKKIHLLDSWNQVGGCGAEPIFLFAHASSA